MIATVYQAELRIAVCSYWVRDVINSTPGIVVYLPLALSGKVLHAMMTTTGV